MIVAVIGSGFSHDRRTELQLVEDIRTDSSFLRDLCVVVDGARFRRHHTRTGRYSARVQHDADALARGDRWIKYFSQSCSSSS